GLYAGVLFARPGARALTRDRGSDPRDAQVRGRRGRRRPGEVRFAELTDFALPLAERAGARFKAAPVDYRSGYPPQDTGLRHYRCTGVQVHTRRWLRRKGPVGGESCQYHPTSTRSLGRPRATSPPLGRFRTNERRPLARAAR